MVSKLAENKRLVLIMAFIFMIQCAALVYWQEQRGNFFLDELFSFGYANSFSDDSSHYITDDELWKYDSWMNSEDLISQIEVNEDNSLLSLPITEQFHLLSTKRTYMGMLNYIMSFTDSFMGYAKGALLLNILFLLVSELLLGKIILILTYSKEIMILSLLMFGFSAIIIGMCEYVRFYMLVIMLLLIVLLCHLKLWKCNNISLFLIIEMIAFISAYYGVKHSELMFVICGSFFCFFLISLLFRRQFRNAIVYVIPLLIGTYIYIYKQTIWFNVLLHPSQFAVANGNRLNDAAYKYINITSERSVECLHTIKDCLSDKWFGTGFIVFVFLGLLIAWSVLIVTDRSAVESDKKEPDKYKGFVLTISLTVATYITFIVLTNLNADRYISFAIVLMMILFWYCVGVLHRECPNRTMLAAFAIVTIACGILGQQSDNFPYLGIEDRRGSLVAEQYQTLDNIIIGADDEGTEHHAAYDCIIHAGKDVRILTTAPDRQDKLESNDLPQQFLLWCYVSGGSDKMHLLIDETGYTVEKLGETHINEIYLCSRSQ